MAAIEILFGGYQGPDSVHTRAGFLFGDKLTKALGSNVSFHFQANIVESGDKAADLLKLVEKGTLTGCYFSSSYLASRVPELGIFDQHFAIPNRKSAYRLLDGGLGARLSELVESRTGFTVLDYWDNGFRHISNRRHAIRSPSDCAGLTIRTLANENHQRVFRALGFKPKTIDVRDLPDAVENGLVDAQENPLTNIYNFGLHRWHRHITLTRHLMGVALALFNKEQVRSWPDDFRHNVQSALREATNAQRRFADDDDEICAEKLAEEGVDIQMLTVDQRNSFARKCERVVAETRAQFSEELLTLVETSLS